MIIGLRLEHHGDTLKVRFGISVNARLLCTCWLLVLVPMALVVVMKHGPKGVTPDVIALSFVVPVILLALSLFLRPLVIVDRTGITFKSSFAWLGSLGWADTIGVVAVPEGLRIQLRDPPTVAARIPRFKRNLLRLDLLESLDAMLLFDRRNLGPTGPELIAEWAARFVSPRGGTEPTTAARG